VSTDWKIDCGSDGVILFGSQSSRYPFAIAPEVGDADRANQDSTLPGIDGNFFGVDTTAGQTVAFGMTAIGETDAEAEALYAALRRAWRADTIRATPGAVATLTAPSGRSTFGRPRRITPAYMPIGSGAIGITADFATQDDRWYGPQRTLPVPLRLSQSGGFVFPLKFPMVSRGYTTAANAFTVDGDVDTWPVITIKGPILNPTVEVPGCFRFSAALTLLYDEQLRIDTRPGRQTVLRTGSKIAALTRTSTLLAAASLSPGSHTFTLSGSSSTGSPTAQIAWRPAYTTP
jgi:hypothetical protein